MSNYYAADLETTTDELDCRVWAVAICEIGNIDNIHVWTTIDEMMEYVKRGENKKLYFHNLKFDAEFIINWLFDNGFDYVEDKKEARAKTFTTLISSMGQFYSMEIWFNEPKSKKCKKLTIIDSLKIVPFSVAVVAKTFGLEDRKGDLDYNKYRAPGHIPTDDELDYIHKDVKIIAQALDILFNQGLDKITQGSNALHDFKRTIGEKKFERLFPPPTYDADIRRSYKGGYTYVSKYGLSKDFKEGVVLDANSMYPWVMRDCLLPYGEGIRFEGKYKENEMFPLYIQKFICHFSLKENHLPTTQAKNDGRFGNTEYLIDNNGLDVEFSMTNIDFELFKEHYEVYNIEYIDGWMFRATHGLFTEYIDKWYAVKNESKANGNKGMYALAKLMLNALYGKFALNPVVQSKHPYRESIDEPVKYRTGEKELRKPLYLPVGTFITSYAREKTIRSAQKVFHRFLYADTDSLHLEGNELPSEIELDDYKLGAWKHEGTFKRARYIRPKTYVEEFPITKEKAEKFIEENPELKNLVYEIDGELRKLEITCAGMPEKCYYNVTFDSFKPGLKAKGKLQPQHVKGGIILKSVDFTLNL